MSETEHVPGCTGKNRYESRAQAKAARKRTSHFPGKPERKLHIYRCVFCGYFHLTHWNNNREAVEAVNVRTVESREAT